MSCALLQAGSMIYPKYFAYFVVFSCVFVIESNIDSLFDSVRYSVLSTFNSKFLFFINVSDEMPH